MFCHRKKVIFKVAMTIFAFLVLISSILLVHFLNPTQDFYTVGAICGFLGFTIIAGLTHFKAIRRCSDMMDGWRRQHITRDPTPSTPPCKLTYDPELAIALDPALEEHRLHYTKKDIHNEGFYCNHVLPCRCQQVLPGMWSPVVPRRPLEEIFREPGNDRSVLEPLDWRTARIVARRVFEELVSKLTVHQKYLEATVELVSVEENVTRHILARRYFEQRVKPICDVICRHLIEMLKLVHVRSGKLTDDGICYLLYHWITQNGKQMDGFEFINCLNSDSGPDEGREQLSRFTSSVEKSSLSGRSASMDDLFARQRTTILDRKRLQKQRNGRQRSTLSEGCVLEQLHGHVRVG